MRRSLLVALACSCVADRPAVRLQKATPIALAFVLDDAEELAARQVPDALVERVSEALAARNLVPRVVAPERYIDGFGAMRDTVRRLGRLMALADDVEQVLLVETQARFYSHLSGRYRWVVDVKMTLAGREREAATDEIEVAALLRFQHEKEGEALADVAGALARHAGGLADRFFGGKQTAAAPLGTVYMVLVDRFANGSTANDGAVDRGDPVAWHGGDLAGVRARLDYLQQLGADTVWLSPVFRTRGEPFMGHGAFHGYWLLDPHQLEPRFGTVDELEALIDEAHGRGMRVLLDFVVNHVAFAAPLVRERPAWFHPARPIEDWNDRRQLTDREVHGLPDLAQENEEVHRWLTSAALRWLGLGADGFRLDAVKHAPMSFWRRFNDELLAEKPDVVLLGEMYDGSQASVARVFTAGRFTHLFDFPLAFELRHVFCSGKSAARIGAVLTDTRVPAGALVTFADNHDLPRLWSACGGSEARVVAALTALIGLRGTPSILYGTEVGLAGVEEPYNRVDMRFDGSALTERVRSLLTARRQHSFLTDAPTFLLGFDHGVLRVLRLGEGAAAWLVINSSDEPAWVAPPAALDGLREVGGVDRLGRRIEVPAHGGRLFVGAAAGAAALVQGFGAPVAVRFEASGVELAGAEQLAVVGSGAALGDWQPTRGAPLAGGSGVVELPAGGLFAYKLVVRTADGRTRWESGDDRYLYLDPTMPEVTVPLAFRG